MILAPTLTLYVARRFLGTATLMLVALTLLVSMFDFIELLRRASTRPDATFGLVAGIAGLRVPFVAMQILPFAILLGGIVAFWRLARASELIVARAAGVSAWGFLAGPVVVALTFGLVSITAISPLSSAMLARAERLDATFLRAGGGVTALAGGRLWLRQSDRGIDPNGIAIVSGRPARLLASARAEFVLTEVTIWRLSATDRALERVEAPHARLLPNTWVLDEAVVFGADRQPRAAGTMALPTDLTPDRIEDSFASPDTLSFWALPGFIAVLEAAGFSALRHRLQFQSMLSAPVLAIAMALLAAAFSMRHSRRGGVARMIGAGVAAGFALFVLDRVTGEFGESGALPVAIAAWVPAVAGLLTSAALLVYQEDG
ncbi:LPS export ABC transporter permease LptG [Sabulicella glaciei]|uniref:LPS export ABC transporter permease LptG n=1 Tax=Sabulicella glaciei TaxID=2984948 RepID=A0ABT3NPM8_9PROT|nr:LPS export ABC transporter permease LptG [Roseococcus sp. MDT2-1-1]MCW8084118.1 LPS export ABC transporter permease LptG [Roseococcus sp. MDT2-1-1]